MKNRYGESDVEVGTNFFGKCGIWCELPKPDDIYDYERYTNPNYLLENNEEITDKPNLEDNTKNDFNFIL